MRIPRPAQRRAILLQHRVEHAEARADHQLEEFGFRIDQEVNERQGPDGGRFNSSDRTGYASAPAVSHHSCTTSSEEPPLSNFNSQWDIP